MRRKKWKARWRYGSGVLGGEMERDGGVLRWRDGEGW